MIASDLHGSAYWTKRLLDAFRRERAERLLLLGDLLDGSAAGPSPDNNIPSTADQLNAVAERIIAVRGNCDSEADQMLLDFPMMADYLSLEVNGLRLYATHGHLWNEDSRSEMARASVIVYGHSHIPECGHLNAWLSVNPGSAAFPRADSVRSYVILRDRTFIWKSLDGIAYQSHAAD